MSSLRITPNLLPRVFECPNCKQTINTGVEKCPFCLVSIEPKIAEAAADTIAKINQACSDASYLRIMAGTILVALLLSFLPLVGFAAIMAFYFLIVGVPIMTIRWWIKFGTLTSDETDWRRAKRTVMISSAIWLVFFVLLIARFASR